MKKQNLKTITMFALLCFSALSMHAQPYLGLAGGNYTGVYNAYVNPAYIVDSRFKLHGSLTYVHANFENNFLSIQNAFSGTAKPNIIENISERKKNIFLKTEVGMPSFYINFESKTPISRFSKFAFGFTARARGMASITGVDKGVGRVFFNRFTDTALYKINFLDSKFEINALALTEYGILGGLTLVDNQDVKIKFAANIKLLSGYAGAKFKFDGIRVRVLNKDSMLISDLGTEYSHSIGHYFQDDMPRDTTQIRTGGGVGLDIGIVYEYTPDIYKMTYQERLSTNGSKYTFRAGASLVDLGTVSFTTNKKVYRYKGENIITKSDYDKVNSLKTLDSLYLTKFQSESANSKFSMSLPTNLNLNFDYRIQPGFYVNAAAYIPLPKFGGYGLRTPFILAATPRIEGRNFEFALPVAIKQMESLQLGFMLKFGFIVIGTDDIGGFVLDDLNSASAYFGIQIPVYRNFLLRR